MLWQCTDPIKITLFGIELEARCWGPPPQKAATLILLHEGLGSVALWKDFPAALAQHTGCGVFAYSRAGYGDSDPVSLPRSLDYMRDEALRVLPPILHEIGFERGFLVGHSDGASIATLFAGGSKDPRVLGICLIAPHFFTEAEGLASIAEAKIAYEYGDLRVRLAKYHHDPDNTFYGWNNAWLDPDFKSWNIEYCLHTVQIPVLAIQGVDDQYGTVRQIEVLENLLNRAPEIVMLDNCAHSPHIEQPEKVLLIIDDFARRIDHNAGY